MDTATLMLLEELGEIAEGSGLPSKRLKNGKWKYRGKVGVWRTLKNGDRVFFTDDGQMLAGARTARWASIGGREPDEAPKKAQKSWFRRVIDKLGELIGGKSDEKPAPKPKPPKGKPSAAQQTLYDLKQVAHLSALAKAGKLDRKQKAAANAILDGIHKRTMKAQMKPEHAKRMLSAVAQARKRFK